jgi:membrane associated rhomboid family serine protease
MFFPYSTDAPIYYWPYTTVAMIVINVLVFSTELANPEIVSSLVLQTGQGLHPYQWLTCNFAHAGFMHILGNMLFLWAFGLVVEGKLGWYKTLAVYLGIGVVFGAITQIALLSTTPANGLGASAIIYGFMAMALVWAPENSLQCVFVAFPYVKLCECSIKLVVGIFLALQVAFLMLSPGALSSELMHLIGAALGFVIGAWMVKTKRVDCENWDLFSIAANRHRMSAKERLAEKLNDPEYQQWQQKQADKRSATALQWIQEQMQVGNFSVALEVYKRASVEQPQWRLPETDLRQLISGLLKQNLLADVIPVMAAYLAHYTTNTVIVRLKLAEALIADNRPLQAMKVLAKLDAAGLDEQSRRAALRLHEKAKQLQEEEPYEVADEDW